MNYLASLIGKYSLHTVGTTYKKPNGETCAIFTRRCAEMINLKLTDLLSHPRQKAPNPDNTAVSKANPQSETAS